MFTTRSSSTLVPLKRPTLAAETTALEDLSELSDRDKKAAILEKYPLPDHWRVPRGRLHRMFFTILCLCANGRADMVDAWELIKLAEDGDESFWLEGRRRVTEQQNNILLLAGLLLATSSVFITTPPPRPDLLNYIQWGSYACVCGAFATLLGAIGIASVMILVTSNLSPTHAKDILFGNRLHLYLTLIITLHPPVLTSIATLLLAFGIASGLWTAQNLAFKLCLSIPLLYPLFVVLLYTISSMPIRRRIPEQPGTMTSSK